MRPHAGAHQGDFADLVVVKHIAAGAVVLQPHEEFHGAGAVGAGAGERNVGAVIRQGGNILDHHVDIDFGVGEHAEHLGSLTRVVGNAQHR